jgi:hypothetical protein
MDGLYSHPPRWAPRRCQSARPTVKNSAERVRGTRPESARCWSNTNFAPCTFRPRESDPPSSGSIARSKSGPEHEARSGPRALRSNSAEPTFHSAARKMQLASSAKIPGETAPQRLRRGRDFLSAVCRSATRVHLLVKRAIFRSAYGKFRADRRQYVRRRRAVLSDNDCSGDTAS